MRMVQRCINNINILIEAFSKLKNEVGNVKLVIAGPDEGHLDKLNALEEFVTFVGNVQNSEIPRLMNASDIFVLPSLSEGRTI